MTGETPGVGMMAPDFHLPEASEEIIDLKEELAKGPVILVFYPSDFGMMCVVELIAFRDMIDQFVQIGSQIIAISTNSTYCHRAFKEQLKLPYPILSDFNGKMSASYGVLAGEEGFMKGRCLRSVFIIDPQGYIRYKWISPDDSEPDYDTLLDIAGRSR